MELLEESGKEAEDAVAEARAAQILAEMLGMVSRPEYYQEGQEQTVQNPGANPSRLDISLSTFLLTS